MSQTSAVILWGTDSVQTSATGASFVQLADHDCDEIEIFNPSSTVQIDIITNASPALDQTTLKQFISPAIPGPGTLIPVTGNAKEISVRRTDLSNTRVFIGYIWRKFRR